MLLFMSMARAQVHTMHVYKNDGTVMKFNVADIDSISFLSIPKWGNRSEEARRLLVWLEAASGEKILTGVHASVDYNSYEADWVYQHTHKYPAINCIDFIHDIYSSKGGWIDYTNTRVWKGLDQQAWHHGSHVALECAHQRWQGLHLYTRNRRRRDQLPSFGYL